MIQDIHDIRPPVMVGMDPGLVRILLLGACALLLIGLVAFGILLWRRRRKKTAKTDLPALPLLSAYECAVRDLEQCMERFGNEAKSFYFELGRVVKAYISGTFGINCLEMTSQEMARAIKGIGGLNPGLKSDLIQFQDQCDPIRYMPLAALKHPDMQRLRRDLLTAGKLVDEMQAAVTKIEENTVQGEGA